MIITFKIVITILLAAIIIIPVSFLCITNKLYTDVDKTYIELKNSFRGKVFGSILTLSFLLFCLSCLSIFPLGVL